MSRTDGTARFLSAAASGTWDWDIARDILRADADFAELYGLDPEGLEQGVPGATFFQAIHPDDRKRIRIAVAGVFAGSEYFSKEFRLVTPRGEVRWMHARGQGLLDGDDRPKHFTGLLVDVTERKRTEERLRIAQSAGGVGTFEYVDGFATAAVSDEFCRLLGLHPASVLPVQTVNSVAEEGGGSLLPSDGAAPESLEAVFRIRRADDGARRWIARRGEIRREGAGYSLTGVIYDVTAAKELEGRLRELNETLESRVDAEVASRRRTEEALRQAQKMEAIGQLTGGVAHDFNNLLMAITSSLALLRKRIPDDSQSQRLIDSATEGAERGAALTQRMLAFARRQDLRAEPVAIGTLLNGMRGLLDRSLGPAWSLSYECPADLPMVIADANQLELAILNLAVNARDAMPDGGAIRIVAENADAVPDQIVDLAPGRYLKLSVVDTGTGMDAQTLARATEPFFTTKGVGKGTGLGLSMIHGLARQLDGTFTLASEPGQGTIATLWLPATADSPAATVPEPAHGDAPDEIGRLKVLAVDDDLLILMNTTALLEDLGHEPVEASDGAQALELIRRMPDIDVLITDQAMPNMTGTELAAQASALRPGLPIILATGYGELPTGAQSRIVKLGKPFTQDQLAGALGEAVRAMRPPAG